MGPLNYPRDLPGAVPARRDLSMRMAAAMAALRDEWRVLTAQLKVLDTETMPSSHPDP